MKRALLITAATAHAVAFATNKPAADAAAASTAPQTAAATAASKAEVNIITLPAGVKIPERAKPRGPGSKFPFDGLAVGGAFGVADRTAKSLATIIGNQNRKHLIDKKDANGSIVYETQTIKDASGVESVIPATPLKAVKEASKRFYAVDVAEADRATYGGASALVVREL